METTKLPAHDHHRRIATFHRPMSRLAWEWLSRWFSGWLHWIWWYDHDQGKLNREALRNRLVWLQLCLPYHLLRAQIGWTNCCLDNFPAEDGPPQLSVVNVKCDPSRAFRMKEIRVLVSWLVSFRVYLMESVIGHCLLASPLQWWPLGPRLTTVFSSLKYNCALNGFLIEVIKNSILRKTINIWI